MERGMGVGETGVEFTDIYLEVEDGGWDESFVGFQEREGK